MKMTLLDMTQNILSAMSSDEVNSISDTTESQQVATIIKTAYFNIITRAGLEDHKQLFQLEGSGDTSLPTIMYVPDNVTKIDWIKYFQVTDDPDISAYAFVEQLCPEEFFTMVNTFRPNTTTIEYTFTSNSLDYTLFYKNDAQPRWCTVLQNEVVLFDAYDSDQDSTLTGSKTMCYGQTVPGWTESDVFVPDLEDFQFPLLLNEAKSMAFVELHQSANPNTEREVKRQWNTLAKNKSMLDKPTPFELLPNFGRMRGRYY